MDLLKLPLKNKKNPSSGVLLEHINYFYDALASIEADFTLGSKMYYSCSCGVERVISTTAYISARDEFGTALSDNYHTGTYFLSTKKA